MIHEIRFSFIQLWFPGHDFKPHFKNESHMLAWVSGLAHSRKLTSADFVIMNFGMHALHLFPTVPGRKIQDEFFRQGPGQIINKTMQLFRKATIVWRTSNYLIDSKGKADWHLVAAKWNASFNQMLDRCQKHAQFSREFCLEGRLSTEGSVHLHRREMKTIESVSRMPSFSTRFRILNAFDLTFGRRKFTVDGRHYPLLCNSELRLLLAMVGYG